VVPEVLNDYNVIAYFADWENFKGKRFLPGSIQTILSSHVDTLFG
jgi:GH18 family chitinase